MECLRVFGVSAAGTIWYTTVKIAVPSCLRAGRLWSRKLNDVDRFFLSSSYDDGATVFVFASVRLLPDAESGDLPCLPGICDGVCLFLTDVLVRSTVVDGATIR